MKTTLAALFVLAAAQDSADDARKALETLSGRMGKAKTLVASFTQERHSTLLDDPITSSGRLYYRRDPEALAFAIAEPRRSHVRFGTTWYRVYRPDEKQLERFEFEDDQMTRGLFFAFHPDPKRLAESADASVAGKSDGSLRITIVPREERYRRFVSQLTLTLSEDATALKGFSYTDRDGDDIRFTLSDVKLDAEIEEASLTPEIPADVKEIVVRVRERK